MMDFVNDGYKGCLRQDEEDTKMTKVNPLTQRARSEIIDRITKKVDQRIGCALDMYFNGGETPSEEKNEIFIKGMVYTLQILGKITEEEYGILFGRDGYEY